MTSSAKLLAAYIRLHVKMVTWNTRSDLKYDYDAGYNENIKQYMKK